MIALVIKAIAAFKSKPVIAKPKAVPDAGGCSVSVTTITKIESPTASEYKRIEYKKDGCGIKAHKHPERKPIK